jgi:hypothetical protein
VERRRRIAERRRLRRPVAMVDQILHELEEIHLHGGIKVPAVTIARIERLMATLPPDCRREFPLRTTITRVMDNLYAVQDLLLTRKDRGRIGLLLEDSKLDALDAALHAVEPQESGSAA